jgi:hypothetical protein
LLYIHYIIGRSSLACSDPGVDLGLELRVCNELFVLETTWSVYTFTRVIRDVRNIVEGVELFGK